MVFTFPSVQRSNSSESTKSRNHEYHYKRISTLHSSLVPEENHNHIQYQPNVRDLRPYSSSSFGSETPRAPARPKSPPPPPKSPKRFWAFSAHTPPPLPPIPTMSSHIRSSSTNSIGLGPGATVVRRPSEAARTMKQHAKASRSASRTFDHPPIETLTREYEAMSTLLEPGTVPLPSTTTVSRMPGQILPATAPLRTQNSRSSLRPGSSQAKSQGDLDKRATIKPPPRMVLPPTPFSCHLISHTSRPAPTSDSSTIIQLDFAYSTDERSKNDSVTLNLEVLKRGGGHLLDMVEKALGTRPQKGRAKVEQRGSLESDKSNPDLTDGESSEDSELDSEYGLEALLRDEHLRSLMLPDSPDLLKSFPPPPPLPESFSITIPSTNKPRAQTRNQYAQQDKFPSPSSPFTARSHTLPLVLPFKQNVHALTISTSAVPIPCPKEGGGIITELKILLLRDAMPYHLIAQRLIAGNFASACFLNEDESRKRKVMDEARWLGMNRLADELSDLPQKPVPTLKHKKSGVITGGQGYI